MKMIIALFCLIPQILWAHTEDLQVIEVAHGKEESSLINFIPSASQLKEKELLQRREISLGDTLSHEVGIQSTSFGPNSGRPIIRGLEGDRIRILQNGLGTLDASSQSVDHAIPIDTLTIDKVEVVRGPMSLLYGSSAVGGVVNIVNNRIHREYANGLVSQFDLRGETVNNGVAGSNRIDYGVNNWMFHFDGAYQNTSDQKIPGDARSKRLQSREPLPPGESEQDKTLKNSANQLTSLAFGASKIYDQGHIGLSYYRFDNEYGTVVEEAVLIKMAQNRVELSTEYRPEGGVLRNVRLRSAQSFYKHEEFEDETVGTTFRNKGNESRLEFLTKKNSWNGISGLQTQFSTFEALGDEAFLPTSDTSIISVFSLQEYHFNPLNTVQFGGRIEQTEVAKEGSAAFGDEDETKNYSGLNGSIGYLKKFDKTFSASVSISYTERAPTFQELFANGAHVATGTFEVGDKGLNMEKGHAFELTLKKDRPDSKLTVSGYIQKFHDYIILSPTGATDSDGLAILNTGQDQAQLYGFEVDSLEELTHSLLGGSWWLNSKADYVIGRNESTDDYLPRMPAPRLTFGLQYKRDKFGADIEWQRYFEQTHTAPNELRTDAFNLVNLGVMYELTKEYQNYRLYFRAKNIFDQEARMHTSFLKDKVPMAGRNFVAGVQAVF